MDGREGTDRAPIVAVAGEKNSGKTTAIERIVVEMARRGYRLGTFKHCHHGYDLDRPGKDSWRHLQAGAARTVLTGPNGMAVVGESLYEDDLPGLAVLLFPDVDLVLAEGYHWMPFPRIEIVASDGSRRQAHADGEVLGTLPHRFASAEVGLVCDRLAERYSKRVSS